MNISKRNKFLLFGGVFGVCLLVGYTSFRNNPSQKPKLEVRQSEVAKANDSQADNAKVTKDTLQKANTTDSVTTSQTKRIQNSVPQQAIMLKATAPQLNGTTYSFQAMCTGIDNTSDCHYELWGKGRKVAESKDGRFSNIPGAANGAYKLCLVGAGNKNLATITVSGFISTNADSNEPQQTKELITKEEFERRMLNPNDNTLQMARKAKARKVLLAPTFKLVVVNMQSGERQVPSDIEGVRDKIHFGIWKSAKVREVTYDEQTGQVTQATIEPLY